MIAFPELKNQVEFKYSEDIEAGELSKQGILEEIVVHAIDRLAGKSFQQLEDSESKVRKFWNAVKRFFNHIMEKIGIKKRDDVFSLLTPSTKLKDLVGYIINNENKYKIDISDYSFNSELLQMADEGTNSHSTILSETEHVSDIIIDKTMDNDVKEIISEVLLLPELTEGNIKKKLLKILKSKYKHKKSKYKGKGIDKSVNYKLGLPKGTAPSRKAQYIGKLKAEISKLIPEQFNMSTDLKSAIDAYAGDIMASYAGVVEFRYKLIENHLRKRINEGIQIKTLDGLDGLSKPERQAIRSFMKAQGWTNKFLSDYKKDRGKDLTVKGKEIIERYLAYNDKELGLTSVVSTEYSNSLNYGDFWGLTPEVSEFAPSNVGRGTIYNS